MSCGFDGERIRALAQGTLDGPAREAARQHVETCKACLEALRGAEAMAMLAGRETSAPRADLFDIVVDAATASTGQPRRVDRFWLGAGFGAIAASLLAVALLFGWNERLAPADDTPEFVVSLQEPRRMDLAFETDRALAGAEIEILLTGSVEIDGYGARRELSWTEDLEAGVNRLSLPVIANGFDGGQIVVRLKHPHSRQTFVVRLPVES